MRKNITTFGLIFFALLGLVSCITEVDLPSKIAKTPPTVAQFKELEINALENLTQHFELSVSDGYTTFVTSHGVSISIDPSCLTKNGVPATGDVDFEIIEIFDKGNMLITNKPTTSKSLSGEYKHLISGGEFYVNAIQDGVKLKTSCGYQIKVPTSLTGEADTNMEPFKGVIDSAEELTWLQIPNTEFWISGQPNDSTAYNTIVQEFDWFNCDKFSNFTGARTALEIALPQGYINENSNLFLAVNGEPNTLGHLYGTFPVGLNCHIILVSEEDGLFKYAIKSIPSLPNNASYIFETSDFQTGTPAQTVTAINALP